MKTTQAKLSRIYKRRLEAHLRSLKKLKHEIRLYQLQNQFKKIVI